MKKFIAVAAAVVLLIAGMVIPASAVITIERADAPYDVVYSVYNDTYCDRISVSCLLTDNLAAMTSMSDKESAEKYGATNIYAYLQLDYRIDGGEWQADEVWETTPTASTYGVQLMPGEVVKTMDLLYLANDSALEDAGVLAKVDSDGKRTFDLDNHTLEFRIRVSMGLTRKINEVVTSEWTDTITVKRGNNYGEAPKELDAPQLLNLEVKQDSEDKCPYLTFFVKMPESVKKAESWLSTQMPTYISTQYFLDNGSGNWTDVQVYSPSGSSYSNETKFLYLSNTDVTDVSTMKVRARYQVYLQNSEQMLSEFSETLSVDTPRWVEGKGILHAKCKVCGVCRPIFGICDFVILGVVIVAAVIAIVPIKMSIDRKKAQKALEEEEKKRLAQAERAARKTKKKR